VSSIAQLDPCRHRLQVSRASWSVDPSPISSAVLTLLSRILNAIGSSSRQDSRIRSFAFRVSSLFATRSLRVNYRPQITNQESHLTPLECALTSHFASEFDLKSFRMRTYVTPGGRGGAPAFVSNYLILQGLLLCHPVLVPRCNHSPRMLISRVISFCFPLSPVRMFARCAS